MNLNLFSDGRGMFFIYFQRASEITSPKNLLIEAIYPSEERLTVLIQ